GVFNDFDLVSTEDGTTRTEHTGSLPFMALDLLYPPGLEGQRKYTYQHDVESFIWVLTWITHCYDNGTLHATDHPLDEWLKADGSQCKNEKLSFVEGM
ncbi:hypothetical protein EDD16DRAFT_1435188, partial [Pisolithus croceorrhizus]